jgi:hypothetical protein
MIDEYHHVFATISFDQAVESKVGGYTRPASRTRKEFGQSDSMVRLALA